MFSVSLKSEINFILLKSLLEITAGSGLVVRVIQVNLKKLLQFSELPNGHTSIYRGFRVVVKVHSSERAHLTNACRATAHAVSNCMNTRASYFTMQSATTCTAPDAGVSKKYPESKSLLCGSKKILVLCSSCPNLYKHSLNSCMSVGSD